MDLKTIFNTTPLDAPNTFKAYADSLPTDRKVYYVYYIRPTDAPDADWGFCRVARYNQNLIAVDAVSFSGKRYSMIKNNTWGTWKYNIQNTDFRRGTAMLTRKPNTITSVTVNFSNPFPSTPLIFLCGNTNGPDEGILSVSNVSTTSFIINVKSQTSTSNIAVYWLAISQ